MDFVEEFVAFIEAAGVSYDHPQPYVFHFPEHSITICLVPIASGIADDSSDSCGVQVLSTHFLYEDVWRREGENVRKRVMAHLGCFRSVFARKCKVVKLDTPQANEFFDRCHTYGKARSRYRYGLVFNDELVAAASFSAPRPMFREDVGRELQSYEWVRYASLLDVRVSGGMGRLLQAFVDDVHPEEVMSYADLEWSDGEVYRRLGFEEVGYREPVEFYVDTDSWQRLSIRKLSSDRAYKTKAVLGDGFVKICNMGSIKYLKRF